ncbi:MAG: hypothetical protein ACTSU5_05770 [Promethearchaeota archaeon]
MDPVSPSKREVAQLEKAVNKVLATRNAASPKTVLNAIKKSADSEHVLVEILKEASLSLISGVGKTTERKLFVEGVTKLGDCLKKGKYQKAQKVLFVKSKKELDNYLKLLRDFTSDTPSQQGGAGGGATKQKPHAKAKLTPPMIEITLPSRPKTPGADTPAKAETEDDDLLDIPDVPPPKVLKTPKLATPEISAQFFDTPNLEETEDVKPVLIDCKWCGKNIVVPVKKKLVLDSELPVVPVTFLHGDPKHALILHLDHDFQVRRRRLSDILEE